MTNFVHVDYPTEHPGVVRAEKAAAAVAALLSAIAHRAGVALRTGFADWAESRRHAAEDRRTWQVAMRDPRIMAELNNAMNAPAANDIRKYY